MTKIKFRNSLKFDQEVKVSEGEEVNFRNLSAIVAHGQKLKKVQLWSHF